MNFFVLKNVLIIFRLLNVQKSIIYQYNRQTQLIMY